MDEGDADRPSTSVVAEVADEEGVDQAELPVKLNDVIDPDALDQLFAPTSDGTPRGGGTVRFRYMGYVVTVQGDGGVTVEPT